MKKSHNTNSHPRLMPHGRLLEYRVDLRHLAAHRATTSSSRFTFKFLLFLGSPSYAVVTSQQFTSPLCCLHCILSLCIITCILHKYCLVSIIQLSVSGTAVVVIFKCIHILKSGYSLNILRSKQFCLFVFY